MDLRCVRVDDFEDAGDEGTNTEHRYGEVDRVTVADLREETKYSSTDEIQSQRPLSTETVDGQHIKRYS